MAFITAQDVAGRLGRDLTTAEGGTVELLISLVEGQIASACGHGDEWIDLLDPVPKTLRLICLEVVSRSLTNPDGLHSVQEQIGAMSRHRSFRRAGEGGDLLLTELEQRMCRSAVGGNGLETVTATSVLCE